MIGQKKVAQACLWYCGVVVDDACVLAMDAPFAALDFCDVPISVSLKAFCVASSAASSNNFAIMSLIMEVTSANGLAEARYANVINAML